MVKTTKEAIRSDVRCFLFLIRMAKSISLSENLGKMFVNCNNLIVVTWNYDDIVEYKGKVIKCVSRAQL